MYNCVCSCHYAGGFVLLPVIPYCIFVAHRVEENALLSAVSGLNPNRKMLRFQVYQAGQLLILVKRKVGHASCHVSIVDVVLGIICPSDVLHLTLSTSNCGDKLQKKRVRAVPMLILLLYMTPTLSPQHPCCLHRQRHRNPSSDSQAKRTNNHRLWIKPREKDNMPCKFKN